MVSRNAFKYVPVLICLISLIITGCSFSERDNAEETSVSVVSEKVLIPGGHSVGVRMDVKGVLVVGLEDIITIDGKTVNPGVEAGLEVGDTIIEVNGEKVYKASEVQRIVNEVKGKLELKIQRKNKIINVELCPVVSKDDELFKLGVWIKDKTAGIGTLTYFDPDTMKFGALGHGITDAETGVVLSVNEGELLNSRVESVKEGRAGKPGEIHGIFYESDAPLGSLELNTEYGLFGLSYEPIVNSIYQDALPVGTQETVREGKASILTTIEGDMIEEFEIEIERITPQNEIDVKSMIIRVTDEDLLKRTGGIVQGMSGSPIIQNGRIIGAVTHVLINDATRGYGIFIEHMLETMNNN